MRGVAVYPRQRCPVSRLPQQPKSPKTSQRREHFPKDIQMWMLILLPRKFKRWTPKLETWCREMEHNNRQWALPPQQIQMPLPLKSWRTMEPQGVSEVQDVSVTVTNVLLYNRPLEDDEITALNKKLSIPKAKDTKTVKVTQPVVSKQATLETEIPSIIVGQQQTEQGSLKTSENEGSGGLSASAVSSVTSSPAAKESEDQSASGTFPEGHSNVDVDSSSEEVQTVDTETGDMVQGDGTQQPSVGTPAAADTNAPTAEIMAHDGTAVTPEFGAHSGANGETVGETDGQGELHAQDGEVNAAALSSSLGNVSQGNNSDAGTVFG
ncbi:trans-sialidase, putative, partial [Trypanosoma cruzi]